MRFLRSPDAVKQNGQLACHGDDCFILGPLASSSGQIKAPSTERRVFSLWSEYMVGTLDQ